MEKDTGGAFGILLDCSSQCGEGKVFLSRCRHWLFIRTLAPAERLSGTRSAPSPLPLSALIHTEIPSALYCGNWLFQGALLVAFCSGAAVFAINLAGASPGWEAASAGLWRALLWGQGFGIDTMGLQPLVGVVWSWCPLWKLHELPSVAVSRAKVGTHQSCLRVSKMFSMKIQHP